MSSLRLLPAISRRRSAVSQRRRRHRRPLHPSRLLRHLGLSLPLPNRYRPLLPHRDAVVLAPFEEVTSDFGRIVRRVNELFGSDFGVFEHSDENVARIFDTIEERNRRKYGKGAIDERSVARPSSVRTRLKSDLLTELEGPALRDLLATCDEVYRRFRR